MRCQKKRKPAGPEVALEALDLGLLGLFVGQRLNERVLERLHAAGFDGIRMSHGYVVQHLIGGERSVTELGRLMGVTQQAASKVTAELATLGYVEHDRGADARVKRIRLSERGRAMLAQTRKLRRELEDSLTREISPHAVEQTRCVLAELLRRLGGATTVERRRLREPRDRLLNPNRAVEPSGGASRFRR